MTKRHLKMRSMLVGLFAVLTIGPYSTYAQDIQSPCSIDLERDPVELVNAENPLSGRLGSILVDWEVLYGDPKSEDGYSPEYDIEGCGTVLLNLNEDDTVVTGITAYAPRDMGLTFYEAGPEDWAIGQAQLVSASFAPVDSELGETYAVPNPYGYFRFDYSSDQLTAEVSQADWEYVDNTPDYGSYSVIYNLTEDETIVSVSLMLSLEDPPVGTS